MKLAEFHAHLGGSVSAAVLWELAYNRGLDTGFRSFTEFQKFLTVRESTHDGFLSKYFPLTELIQSGPEASRVSAFHAVAKAFRRNEGKLSHFELRFDPLKRSFKPDNQVLVNQVVRAVMDGLKSAGDCYGVTTKLILCGDRSYPTEKFGIIASAAVSQNVDGLDVCGKESSGGRESTALGLIPLLEVLKPALDGRFLTYHIGESPATTGNHVLNVIRTLSPKRIGHGLQLLKNEDLLVANIKLLDGVTFEICPTVSMLTSVASAHDLAIVFDNATKYGIRYVICTDNAYLANTTLTKEYDYARSISEDFYLQSIKHSEQLQQP